MPELDQILFGGSQQNQTGGLEDILFSNNQPTQNEQQGFSVPETAKPSPISLVERMKLSFADDQGREKYLKKRFNIVEKLPSGKFAVGTNVDDVAPIDPEGLFNDVLGDLSDVVSEIPVIAGQIVGATSGISGGPGGVVLGGAVGSGAGEAIRIGIGKTMGVRESSAMEEATDIALVSAFGALGEGLGQALKFTGSGISKLAAKNFDKAMKTSSNPSIALSTLGKIFRITAAIDPEDVVLAGTYGFEKTLQPKYMNQEFSRTLMTKFVKGLTLRNKALGKMVGDGKKWAINRFGDDIVPIEQAGQNLILQLSDPSINLLDDLGRINKSAFTESSDFKAIKNFAETFFAKNARTDGMVPRDLPLRQALDFKDKSKPFLNRYFKSNGVNKKAQAAIAQYLDEITAQVGKVTGKSGIPVDKNPFIRANARFSQWRQDIELLKQNGLDVVDVNDINRLVRNGRVVSQKIENFFERFKVKNSSANEAFALVSDKLPVKFPGGGIGNSVGTLTDELKKYNAAQGFSNANPNFLRFASVAGIVGLNIGRDDPAQAATSGALGLLLSTPTGARVILRSGSKIGKVPIKAGKLAQKVLKKDLSRESASALLSRLLQKDFGKERN